MGPGPEGEPTTARLGTVVETETGTKDYIGQFNGTVPPSPLDVALKKLRVGRTVFIRNFATDILLVEACSFRLVYA